MTIKLRVGRYYRFRDEERPNNDRHVRVLYVGPGWAKAVGCEGPKNVAVTAVFFGELCLQVLEHDADTGQYRDYIHSDMDLVEDVTAKVKAELKRAAEAKAARETWNAEFAL